MTDTDDGPQRCPDCGSTDIRRRKETGGGWRTVWRCGECGHRITPDDRDDD